MQISIRVFGYVVNLMIADPSLTNKKLIEVALTNMLTAAFEAMYEDWYLMKNSRDREMLI